MGLADVDVIEAKQMTDFVHVGTLHHPLPLAGRGLLDAVGVLAVVKRGVRAEPILAGVKAHDVYRVMVADHRRLIADELEPAPDVRVVGGPPFRAGKTARIVDQPEPARPKRLGGGDEVLFPTRPSGRGPLHDLPRRRGRVAVVVIRPGGRAASGVDLPEPHAQRQRQFRIVERIAAISIQLRIEFREGQLLLHARHLTQTPGRVVHMSQKNAEGFKELISFFYEPLSPE